MAVLKLCVLKVSKDDGTFPSMQEMDTVRQVIIKAAKEAKEPEINMLLSGMTLKKEIFEVPEGFELALVPDVPMRVQRKKGEVIEGEVVKDEQSESAD